MRIKQEMLLSFHSSLKVMGGGGNSKLKRVRQEYEKVILSCILIGWLPTFLARKDALSLYGHLAQCLEIIGYLKLNLLQEVSIKWQVSC